MNLVEKKDFRSEDEFENYILPKLTGLFGVGKDRISNQILTTPFEYYLSNRADIVVKSKGDLNKILVVIELKLEKNIEKYTSGDWEIASKQLFRYCQDVRAPYGVLMTEEKCLIYRYRWYKEKDNYCDHPSQMPNIKRVEEIAVLDSFIEIIKNDKSTKYVYLFALFLILMGEIGYKVGLLLQKSGNIFVYLITLVLVLIASFYIIRDLIRIER